MLDNWLFFCFDILLLIFVLGISIYIVKTINKQKNKHYEEAICNDITRRVCIR